MTMLSISGTRSTVINDISGLISIIVCGRYQGTGLFCFAPPTCLRLQKWHVITMSVLNVSTYSSLSYHKNENKISDANKPPIPVWWDIVWVDLTRKWKM